MSMAKKAKSGDAISGSNKWDQCLSTIAFEEESWCPCIAWVVGRQWEDFKHIEALNIITQIGRRKLFAVISKEQLYLDVQEYGGIKNKKTKDAPAQSSEICETCKPYLDAEVPIPTPLLAKLLKWKMLTLKEADMKRRVNESKIHRSKSADKKKGKDQKDAGKERGRSPKKGKKSPEVHQAKEGSKLKKRGEDDDENKFIDDEPDDGAQFYILVTGFHDPNVFEFLENININVNCVIAVSSQDYSTGIKLAAEDAKLEDEKKNELKNELKVFWRDLHPILQRPPDTSSLHDIARLDYEVSSLLLPTDPLDAEHRVNYSMAIFDDIASMLYNLFDAKRLYLTYLENLKLIHVPLIGEKEMATDRSTAPTLVGVSTTNVAPPEQLPTVIDMKYYNDLMNTVPLESVSVPLIMHCMLEQVVATELGSVIPSEQVVPSKVDGLNSELSAYFNEMAAKLGLSSDEHEMLSEVLDLPPVYTEKGNTPELINFHDGISKRTNHLKPHYGFDAKATEKVMLQHLPFAKLCHMQLPSLTESRQRAVRVQELFHHCASTGLTQPEIDHALKQFVFECMDLTKCDRNGFPLQRVKEGLHQQPIPWDDPYPFYKMMIPVSEKCTLENLMASTIPIGDIKGNREEELSQQLGSDISAYTTHKSKQSKIDTCSTGYGSMISVRKEEPVTTGSQIESKRGILVPSNISRSSIPFSPRHSISNSVRFDVPSIVKESEDTIDEVQTCPSKSTHENVLEVIDAQQRYLNSWCYAEHYKPHILLQILQEASYHYHFFETYQHKRDPSLMLILHNPYNKERQNNISWHKELHSNTGFRNYLENTVESIQVWLKKKDAEYQAHLLSKELSNLQKEDDEKIKALEKAERRGKKSPVSVSKSRGSLTSAERLSHSSSNPFIRQGSIKAWQAEQMKLAYEEEEREKLKLEKRTRSSPKLKDKDKQGKGKDSSIKQQKDDFDNATIKSDSQITDVKPESEIHKSDSYWPFYGYDTGNKLIHIFGATSSLFPSDGGIIRTERTDMVQGTISVRSVVEKDGHVFVVHILNPREDMNLPEDYIAQLEAVHCENEKPSTSAKPEVEKQAQGGPDLEEDNSFSNEQKLKKENENKKLKAKAKKSAVSQFGSITAHLSDGMVLSLSQFGPTGESYLQPYEPPVYVESIVELSRNVTPTRSKGNLVKTKKSESTEHQVKEKPATIESAATGSEENKEKTTPPLKQNFQELSVTCPDGLTVKYFLQSSVGVLPLSDDDRHLVVRQSYPLKTKGVQDCESARIKHIQSEISRVITADGSVVKNMVDGSVEVLSWDGTVSVFTGTWVDQQHPAPPDDHVKGKGSGKSSKRQSSQDEAVANTSNWVITYPNGERIQIFKESDNIVELPSILVCIASDPQTKQIMTTRDDRVMIINYPNGANVVEHADGTHISTYYRDVAMANEKNSPEEPTEKISMQPVKFVKVECPAFATVEFNTATSENLTAFGNKTSINVFPDGYYMLHHSEGGRIEIDTEGALTYFPCRNNFLNQLMPNRELQYIMCHNADVIVETLDPHGNMFNVLPNGEAVVFPTMGEDVYSSRSHQILFEDSLNLSYFDNHAPRLFIIHEDGSGTELLRSEDVSEYLLMAEQNPAAALLKESLPGHPGVVCITVLKPYLSGVSEKWIKKYDQETIVPQGLRCRDLKTLPPKEYKNLGPKFGTNVGMGLNIGTNVKAPVRIPILKCPEKLEYRQLLQYKPITEYIRRKLKTGLKEYANAVVARMQMQDLVAIKDPRTEEEKVQALHLKSLSQKVDIQELELINLKVLYEQAVAPPPPQAPRKVPAKRNEADQEREKKEREEIMEKKFIIKNNIFEPYFQSELGLAFNQVRATQNHMDKKSSLVEGRNKATHANALENRQKVPQKSSVGSLPNPVPKKKDHNPSIISNVDLHSVKVYSLKQDLMAKKPDFKKKFPARNKVEGMEKGKLSENLSKGWVSEILPVKPAEKTSSEHLFEFPGHINHMTASGIQSRDNSILTKMKCLKLNQKFVNFNVLKEGNMYSHIVMLTNTGLDACRFRIKQPPPATGLRVNFSPGPVAAGMSAELNLELYAIASEMDETSHMSQMSHTLEIITENDYIQLPIAAIILTADDYDNPEVLPRLKRWTVAQCLSKKPHATIRQFLRNRDRIDEP